MSEQDNLRIVQETFDAWNAHDAARLAKFIHDDYVWESDTVPAPLRGVTGAVEALRIYVTAFPDLHLDVEQRIASGDNVITRWHSTGTHKGELMGIPPTGRRGPGIHGCTVSQLRDGKVVRDWVYWDVATLLRQLGVLPPLPEGAGR